MVLCSEFYMLFYINLTTPWEEGMIIPILEMRRQGGGRVRGLINLPSVTLLEKWNI